MSWLPTYNATEKQIDDLLYKTENEIQMLYDKEKNQKLQTMMAVHLESEMILKHRQLMFSITSVVTVLVLGATITIMRR